MLENEIIECCKKLKLSRNLADMAQITEGVSHQEYWRVSNRPYT